MKCFWVLLTLIILYDLKYCFLSVTDPQPPLSSTFEIKNIWGFVCYKSYMNNAVGTIRWVLGLDMTSQFNRSSHYSLPSCSVKAKMECSSSRDRFGWQVTDCPVSSPEVLRVTTHSEEEASLVGILSPAEVWSASSTDSDNGEDNISIRLFNHLLYGLGYSLETI